jgi:23S rRNA U2552 (ribose-2'-O)-methylase RlmE/FtsJ
MNLYNKSFITSNLFNELNNLKNQINDKTKWAQCVKLTNYYENVNHFDKYKRISRAFYKLYELDYTYDIIDKKNDNLKVGNLCEAPGGFTECILVLRKNIPTKIFTQSILECEIQFSKKIPKDLITFGSQMTGDLYNPIVIQDFVNKIPDGYDLITADGGIDVSKDYKYQEQLSIKLILAQILTAFKSLKTGGTFVLKVFDIFMLPTIQLLFLVYNNFNEFIITKPIVSRPCNSEKYIIAKKFKGNLDDVSILLNNLNKNTINDIGVKVSKEFEKIILNTNIKMVGNQINSLKITLENYKHINNHKFIQQLKNYQFDETKKYSDYFKIHNLINYL